MALTRRDAKDRARQLLGERIERALQAVGVHQAVKAIERRTGWDCGCARRKAALNAWSELRR